MSYILRRVYLIKECSTTHLQECADIAFLRNNQPETNSAYCPTSKESILNEFTFLMGNPSCLVIGHFANNTLTGVLGCFTNPDNNWVDCLGPFFADEWCANSAQEMFTYAKSKLPQAARFNFYFNTKNNNLHQLMSAISATRNDNEYSLILEKPNHIPQQLKHKVIAYTSAYENDIISLKNETWPESYITDNDLLNSINKNREIFCALDNNGNFVGYGILKLYENTSHATAEVFAVKEEARGKGYGWALLSTVVDNAFSRHNANTIDLVVDKLNTHARDLYYSCGFKLSVENAAYNIAVSI